MDYSSLEKKLQSFNGSYKEFPFGDDAAVFKVLGKMFALVVWQNNPLRITLKCDPGEADMLRSQFDAIKPGYYMNKNHWNTITLDDSIPEDLLLDMIESSYGLVVKSLSKANRENLSKKQSDPATS
jgi:predicted DNA-binding protein (MmcQ/YjbR family)